MAITRSMVNLVLAETEKAGSKKVKAIDIVLGEMSGVVDRSVQFYFDIMSKGTAAEGAELHFKNVPTQARCRKCGNVFHPGDIFWACDKCQSLEVDIIGGSELRVESIEVE